MEPDMLLANGSAYSHFLPGFTRLAVEKGGFNEVMELNTKALLGSKWQKQQKEP
jgi:hypothetical protein